MKIRLLSTHIITSALLVSPLAYSATEMWSVDGFKNPESAFYDSERDIGNQLLVAPWGKELQEDFSTKVLGHMIAVDLTSKSVTTVGSGKPVGNLDGLEPDGQGNWLVTDWVDGALYRIHADGQADMLMDLGQGSADLGILDGGAIALVPMMMDDKVTAISTR